jgi:hypothetical protein
MVLKQLRDWLVTSARHRHRGVVIARGSRDEGELAVDHGAAVAGGFLERGAGGNQATGHVLGLD